MSDTIEQPRVTATVDRDARRRLLVRLVVLAALGFVCWLLGLAFGASAAHANTVGTSPSAATNHAATSDDSSLRGTVHGLLGRTVNTADQAVQPVVKPVAKAVVRPVVKTVVRPLVKPVVASVVKPVVVKPVVTSVVAPVVRTVVRPIVKTVVTPVVTPVVQTVKHAVAAVPADAASAPITEPAAGARHAAAAQTAVAVPAQTVAASAATTDAVHTLAPPADSVSTADLHSRMSAPQPNATGNAPQSPVQPAGGVDPSGVVGGAGGAGAGSSTSGGAGAVALATDGAASATHLASAPVGRSSDTAPTSLAQPTGSSPD